MKFICEYQEWSRDHTLPSIKNHVSDKAIQNKSKVLKHLKVGTIQFVATKVLKDHFTGEYINMELCTRTDGVYVWTSEEAYYFEKYNLELNDDFIAHVLRQDADY